MSKDAMEVLRERVAAMEREQAELLATVRKAAARPVTRAEARSRAREHMTAGLKEHFEKEAGNDDD